MSRAFAPGTTTMVFSPASSTVIERHAGRLVHPPYGGEVDAVRGQQRERLAGRLVLAHRGEKGHVSAQPAGGEGLVGALAAGHPAVVRGRDRVAAGGQPGDPGDQVQVHAADHHDPHAATPCQRI